MKEKKLIFFVGKDWESRGGRLYIAAHSKTDAARLMELAKRVYRGQKDDSPIDPFFVGRNVRRMNDCFREEESWSDLMKGKPVERGVWHEPSCNGLGNGHPVRLV